MGIFAHGFLASSKKAKLLAAVLVLGTVIAVATWISLSGLKSTRTVKTAGNSEKTAKSQNQTLAEAFKDSDNDGLKDWEEAIWKTDAAKPDSDGDGTNDGDEIAQSRDPLKKGPDDKLSLSTPEDKRKTSDAEAKNNLTYNLAKSILESGAIEAIGPDGSVTSTAFLKNVSLPENMDAEALLKPSKPISLQDFKIIQADDTETIRQYFNSLAAAYAKQPQITSGKGDITILSEAVASGDYSKLAKLEAIASGLERLAADVKKIAVPRTYLNFAVKELDYIIRTKRAVEILRNAQSDPLAAAIVLPKRIEIYQQIAELHRETSSEIKAQGITFRPQESGYAYFR